MSKLFAMQMKKITCLPAGKVLPTILLLAAVLFLPSKADAQTRQECEKTRDRASYNCLLEFGKCYSPCVAETKDNTGCRNSCKQAENACDKQVDTDYQACLAAIKKDSESPPETNASSEVQTNTDCHGVFTKESNACLKESTKCINSCVDKANEAMSLTVDGGKVMQECTKSVCDPASEACNDKTAANFRACLDARKADGQPKTAEAKKETSMLDGVRFLGERTFQIITDWTTETKIIPMVRANTPPEGTKAVPLKGVFRILPNESQFGLFETVTGKDLEETVNWQPIITNDVEEKTWKEFLPIYTSGKENITATAGQGEIKTSASPQFIPIEPKSGDTVQVTYLDSTVRSTSDAVQLRYTWSPDSGAVINVPKWSEIKFKEPVEVGGFTSRRVELGQGEIEVKIKNNKPSQNQFGVDAGWLGATASRTHFWVSQSQDKKMAVIGVYEGEVEVKTKDGQTVKVKPDGDPSTGSGQGKPGVVVISQKLSPVKLSIVGVVLAAFVGSIIFLLKKRTEVIKSSKKR